MERVAIIGFGEAARAFVGGGLAAGAAYDIDPARRYGIGAHDDLAGALNGAGLVLSLVTADQALAAAEACARCLKPGALYCDGNSVSPDTKRTAARAIEQAGGDYVDLAILAPVHPLRLGVPLLLAGARAAAARDALHAIGFRDVAIAGERVGEAAAIKMIRSVMIKGIEALSAELAAAADAAGVREAVVASLDAGWNRELGWGRRIEGSLERIARHGARRAAEMDEVAATLASLGVEPRMARATAAVQRAGVASQDREQAA